MAGSGKKKKKKLLLGIIAGVVGNLFPAIVIAVVVSSGVNTVVDFFKGIGEKIGNFFTGDQVLEQVADEQAVTDEELDRWMISRSAMIYLLTETEEFNNREAREKTFRTEGTKSWSEYEPTPTPTPTPSLSPAPVTLTPMIPPSVTTAPGDTSGITITLAPTVSPLPFVPAVTHYSEKEETDILICESRELLERYKVSWQMVYMFCIYHYMDTNEDISTAKIDEILELLKPEIVYEFDPVSYWEDREQLTESDITGHRHEVIEYDETVTGERIVDGIVHHVRLIPKFKIKEVNFAYGKDVYEYKMVQVSPGKWEEMETYHRVYDKDKFLNVIGTYIGSRDSRVFMVAFEQMPGVEGLVAELEKVLEEE